MARNRTPRAKAEVSGTTIKHGARFRNRRGPTKTRPIGEPYAGMKPAEVRYWREYAAELPWLHSSHRVLLRMACVLSARMDSGQFGDSAAAVLGSILSKMGATPQRGGNA
jgi:hypothetical protein